MDKGLIASIVESLGYRLIVLLRKFSVHLGILSGGDRPCRIGVETKSNGTRQLGISM